MARNRKGDVNISEAIRNFLKANKGVGPTEAARAISEQVGKKVSPTYVSNIKSNMLGTARKKGRQGRKPGRKAAKVTVVSRARSNGSVDLATISAIKGLLQHVSADTAKQLIDLLA